MKNALKQIADTINELIKNDPFPDTIQPAELRTAVRAYPERGGKRIRPALLMWACGLFGGDPEKVLNAAASVEIFHNWTLVHDDIIDEDHVRRGLPTCHIATAQFAAEKLDCSKDSAVKYGHDLALLAGDSQQAWAMDMMLKQVEAGSDPALVIAIARRMQEILNCDLISGEACDVALALKDPASVTEDDVLAMIDGKTSALLTFCVQAGAAFALGSADFESEEQKTLAHFTHNLGRAYQLLDDLLGIYGEMDVFGKPLCSDFQERKPTLLYLEAKKRLSGKNADLLVAMTGQPFYSSEMVSVIRNLLTDCGAEQAIRDLAKAHTDAALAALDRLPQNTYCGYLRELTASLLRRGA